MPKALGWLAEKKNKILTQYGDAHGFALTFNPSVQVKCALNIERSLMGNAPTIRQLLYTYELPHLQVWIMAHLQDLNEYVGVKNKMNINQMKELAQMIIVNSQYLMASEILLFFYKLKGGDFGGFYGAIDPLKVGEQLQAFKQWRSQELTRLKHKKEFEERERYRIEHQKHAITREEYEKARAQRAK